VGVLLALLFFAIGLNLMGAFETGSLMPRGLAHWRAERPAVYALGSGVLAVLAAMYASYHGADGLTGIPRRVHGPNGRGPDGGRQHRLEGSLGGARALHG